MLKYREPPLSLEKTTRLITFLHHVLKIIPIAPTVSKTGFPLGSLLEDMTLTLSTQQPHIWIVSIQFLLSCLKSASQQQIYHAGVTTPVILIVIKHVLLELTRLPYTNIKDDQETCFAVGKSLLDFFLVRDDEQYSSQKLNSIHVSFYDVIHSVSLNVPS